MTDTRLRNYAAMFVFAAFALMFFVAYRSCTHTPEPIFTVQERTTRTTDTVYRIVPVQKIDSVQVLSVKFRTKFVHDTISIIDTCNFIAYSDTIVGAKGTEFTVTFDSQTDMFSVPYLKERGDTTITIRDSVVIERERKAPSTFWSDVGKVAGGVVGGLLLGIGLR
jgi:hypothetical protein